jgi:hypothetical protein
MEGKANLQSKNSGSGAAASFVGLEGLPLVILYAEGQTCLKLQVEHPLKVGVAWNVPDRIPVKALVISGSTLSKSNFLGSVSSATTPMFPSESMVSNTALLGID